MHQLRPPAVIENRPVVPSWQQQGIRRTPSPREKQSSGLIESKGRWSIYSGRGSIAETNVSSGMVSMEITPRPSMLLEEAESELSSSDGVILPLTSGSRRAGAGSVTTAAAAGKRELETRSGLKI